MFLRYLPIVLLSMLLVACGKGGVNDFKAPESMPVAEVFEQGCAKCHGSDAGGKMGFMYTIDVNGKSAPELAATILSGREGMPSFPNLTEQQRLALAEHVLKLRQP